MSKLTIEDARPFHARGDWVMAALCFALAGGVLAYLGPRLTFDPSSPAFSPAVLLPAVSALFGARYLARAVAATLHARRHGRSTLEIDGPTVRAGSTLRGVVCAPPRAGARPATLRIRCIESARLGPIGDRRHADRIRYEAERRFDADPRGTIEFEFVIPGPDAAPWNTLRGGPVRWTLEVEAVSGTGKAYSAWFGLPIVES